MSDNFGGHAPEFLTRLKRRMDDMDSWPKALRELAHEHNYGLIKAFRDCGVTKPGQIKMLIQRVREGGAAYVNGVAPMHCVDCPHKRVLK